MCHDTSDPTAMTHICVIGAQRVKAFETNSECVLPFILQSKNHKIHFPPETIYQMTYNLYLPRIFLYSYPMRVYEVLGRQTYSM